MNVTMTAMAKSGRHLLALSHNIEYDEWQIKVSTANPDGFLERDHLLDYYTDDAADAQATFMAMREDLT